MVACTPYGREITVSLLYEYMKRDHALGVLDEWQLWMNTDPHQVEDVAYANKLAAENDWIVQKYRPAHRDLNHHKQYNTRTFFEYCTEPDTVYIRFDDDIIYVHPGTIEILVTQKLASPAFVTFPIIWNNAISTWYLQMQGSVPREWGAVQPYCMDPIGWADGPFAARMHHYLLDNIEAGTVDSLLLYHDVQLPKGQQFSVSCFACLSEEYHNHCDPPGFIDAADDEHWHSIQMPTELDRPNMIAGSALVSHFTFYPQREFILTTNILDRYREVASRIN